MRRAISRELRLAVFTRDDFRCGHCGLWLFNEVPGDYDGSYAPSGYGRHLQVDHILPVARGGTNDPRNLQTLCDLCNLRKGVGLDDWEDRELLREAIADSQAARAELAELRAEQQEELLLR